MDHPLLPGSSKRPPEHLFRAQWASSSAAAAAVPRAPLCRAQRPAPPAILPPPPHAVTCCSCCRRCCWRRERWKRDSCRNEGEAPAGRPRTSSTQRLLLSRLRLLLLPQQVDGRVRLALRSRGKSRSTRRCTAPPAPTRPRARPGEPSVATQRPHAAAAPAPPHWLLEGATHDGADLARQSKGRELAIVDAVLVEVANVNLDARVVLGRDELVAPRAARAGSRGRCTQGGRTKRTTRECSTRRVLQLSWRLRRWSPQLPQRSAPSGDKIATHHLRGMYRSTVWPSSLIILPGC